MLHHNKTIIIASVLGMVCLILGAFFFYISTLSRTNSLPADIFNNPLSTELSPSPSPVQPIRLLFGGDLMFDRHIRLRMQENSVDFVLEPLADLFQKYDAVVANLEGPVTTFPSRSVGSAVGSPNNFIFTFDPEILPMLKRNNFTILDLGNNHINNMGKVGWEQTKTFLEEEGIHYFGNTNYEETAAQRIYVKADVTPTLAFVGYNQFVPDGLETALVDVEVAQDLADLVIVMPHWGLEYETTANEVIQAEAYQLIDAGADLIIGGHPHVVQQSEVYQGKTIYYSLGNFVFDQYFQPEVQQGLLVGVEIWPDGNMSFEEYPIFIERSGQTRLAE